MKNFKILAIKPLSDCPSRFTKSIKPGEIYYLYNNYKFLYRPGTDLPEIQKHNIFPEDYFNIINNNHSVSLNISAIVGKNGSGKSSLFELIYYSAFVIGHKAGIINPTLNFFENQLKKEKITNQEKEAFEGEKAELEFILNNLKVIIYYELNDSFYCITINKDVKLEFVNGTEQRTRDEKLSKILDSDKDLFEYLFYSISINYSLHGLNSKQIGTWIESLFHKNDGYQAPLVINPMRTEGNINVNGEFHLAQSRMLSNLTSLDTETPEIINGKTLSEVEFTIYPSEIDSLNGLAIRNIFQGFEQKNNLKIFDFFAKISEELIGHKITDKDKKLLEKKWNEDSKKAPAEKFHFNYKPEIIEYEDIYYLFAKYVVRKIFKIVDLYTDYKTLFNEDYSLEYSSGQEVKLKSIKNPNELIKKLKDDTSHITYKVKQALFSIKGEYFNINWKVELDSITGYNYCFKSKIDYPTLKKLINNCFSENEEFANEKIATIPCALVKPNFKVTLPNSKEKGLNFHSMSSGELQFAFTVHTLYYHIQNINSVISTTENKKIKYRNINLMLDEIELYFHPEFQQDFIDELLKGLSRYKLNYIDSINIIFLTHSPFILSDIPAINLLKLDKGLPLPYDSTEVTLGANIHSLLAHDFYLSKGFMGKRARLAINDLFSFLQEHKTSTYKFTADSAKLFIKNIGEPILKHELSKLYDLKFPGAFELEIIDVEMAKLEKLKERLRK